MAQAKKKTAKKTAPKKTAYTHISLVIDSSGSMESIRQPTIENYNKFIEEQKKIKGKATLSHFEFSSGSKVQVKNARETKHMFPFLSKPVPPTLAVPNNIGPGLGVGIGVAHAVPNFSQPQWFTKTVTPNSEFSIVEDFVDIQNAISLNKELFVPWNMTPLLDSIGRGIAETQEKIGKLAKKDKPDRVLFVIITDGGENASTEYTRDEVKNIIEHYRTKEDWDFIFLGANIDAIATGTSFGVSAGMSVNYTASVAGSQGSTQTLSSKVGLYRSTSDFHAAKASLNYTDDERSRSLGVGVTPDPKVANKTP